MMAVMSDRDCHKLLEPCIAFLHTTGIQQTDQLRLFLY